MLPVLLSARAKSTLIEISDYYSDQFPVERALKIIASLEECFEKIAASPKAFPVCYGINNPPENKRQAIVHNTFKVIYHIGKENIEIMEIFHGSRNPELLREIE